MGIRIATAMMFFLSLTGCGLNGQGRGNATDVVTGLRVPWEIVFLPDGRMFITERGGTIAIIRNGQREATIRVEGAVEIHEGGLHGAALHPDFNNNRRLYLYMTTRRNGSAVNRVVSYRFENNRIEEERVIIDDIPGSTNHDGGRIAFGPDGYLFITTGDAGETSFPQNTNSLAGKILRLADDGSIPPDNPFGNAVYSYGHRNPQSLAWDAQGRLWSTEHGPNGYDEVNLIEKGANYGWPVITGGETRPGMRVPAYHSGRATWAPAGADIVNGRLFFAGLRGNALFEADITGKGGGSVTPHFRRNYGRLRAVVRGPSGELYFSTSNRDGRGSPREGDDRVLRVTVPE